MTSDTVPNAVAERSAAEEPAKRSGLTVLHLFCSTDRDTDSDAILKAIESIQNEGCQVVTVAMLGHKADLGVMVLADIPEQVRRLQSALTHAACRIGYSYLSLTELSEYASGLPPEMQLARLRPHLPPAGLQAFCFYPMSKRRVENDNWYRLEYAERLALMREHGSSGRAFRGRILQLITGSTGLDDYEWGVTLFGRTLDDLKDCVYQMRFDEASARFAEFGAFLTGIVASPAEVLELIGNDR